MIYGSAKYQILFSGQNDPQTILQGNDMEGNLLIATATAQRTFQLNVDYNDVNFGDSDNNTFYHPQGGKHIAVVRDLGGSVCTTYSLAEWRDLSGKESHSKDLSPSEGSDADPRIPVIFINPRMETATFDLTGQRYMDVDGKTVEGTIGVAPFESIVLFPIAGVTGSTGGP
jgi:hypothetical protein